MTDTGNELSEILSETPPASGAETTTTTTEQVAPDTGANRDEHGRFAPKAEDQPQAETQPVVEQQPAAVAEQTGAMVPQQALHAARQENADLKRKLDELTGQVTLLAQQRQQPATPAQQQEVPKPRDIWDDPDAYTNERVQSALTPLQQSMIFNARLTANAINGEDKVNAAMTAFDELNGKGQLDPTEYRKVMSSPNPFHSAVEWHKRHSAISRVGNDPDAWFQAEYEKRLSDPAEQAKILERIQAGANANNANNRSAPVTKLPPTLSGLPGGTNNAAEADLSDAGLFANATQGLGRRK